MMIVLETPVEGLDLSTLLTAIFVTILLPGVWTFKNGTDNEYLCKKTDGETEWQRLYFFPGVSVPQQGLCISVSFILETWGLLAALCMVQQTL